MENDEMQKSGLRDAVAIYIRAQEELFKALLDDNNGDFAKALGGLMLVQVQANQSCLDL